MAGANTYSGDTTIGSGSIALNINNATALSGGALIVNNTLTLDNTSGAAITLTNNNPLTLSGGSLVFTGTNDLNFGTGNVSLTGNRTITVNAGTLTLGGNISGGGTNTITKDGAGTLVLDGTASTYTGQTLIQGGTLSIKSIKNVGVSSSVGAPTTVANGTIEIGTEQYQCDAQIHWLGRYNRPSDPPRWKYWWRNLGPVGDRPVKIHERPYRGEW